MDGGQAFRAVSLADFCLGAWTCQEGEVASGWEASLRFLFGGLQQSGDDGAVAGLGGMLVCG